MKDDMTAFIEGLGMRRFFGYVECEEIPSVLWDSAQNPDGWKDFVELAKSTGAPFLTMHFWALDREEFDRLSQRLADGDYSSDEDMEEARWLRAYIGKTGFVQLGWAYQGCVFVYEAGTEWYEHYQHLRELADDAGGFMIDEPDQDEERLRVVIRPTAVTAEFNRPRSRFAISRWRALPHRRGSGFCTGSGKPARISA